MTSNDEPVNAALPAALPITDRVTAFLSAVYGWMCIGLALTATTAWFIARSPTIVSAIASNRLLFWGLMIAQLGIVFVLSARVQRLAASTAALLFMGLMGVVLASIVGMFWHSDVVEDTKYLKLVGVVTERDVCSGVAADDQRASDVRVDAIMRPSSACCGVDEPVEEGRRKLHAQRATSLPVVDSAGGCCGTISIDRLEKS